MVDDHDTTNTCSLNQQSQQLREQELREWLKKKPCSALLMARLSDVLMQTSGRDPSCPSWRIEAVKWAHQAMEQAPHRPYGYIALSFAAFTLQERMSALDRAIELTRYNHSPTTESNQNNKNSNNCDYHDASLLSTTIKSRIPVAILLARRLIEPRQEEIQQILLQKSASSSSPSLGRGDSRHPSRRDLNASEAKLYTQLQAALEEEWKWIHPSTEIIAPTTITTALAHLPATHSDEIALCLGKYEYRLGTFFRKMEPRSIHRLDSQRHFQRVVTQLASIAPSRVEEAQFWLATLADPSSNDDTTTTTTISRCPSNYIVGLYSTFAKRFDTCLVQSLHYQTPSKLRGLVDEVLTNRQPKSATPSLSSSQATTKQFAFRRALDLGCGTGLSGIAFSDCVQYFRGVDLSSEMLEQARNKGCYHELIQGDLVSYLQQQMMVTNPSDQLESDKYDLIVASDVLVYLGDLRDTLVAVYHLLSERGIFAGSTEYYYTNDKKDTTSSPFTTNSSNNMGNGSSTISCGRGYLLQDSGRFAHTKEYLETLTESVGLQMERLEIMPIRKNNGKDVMGMLFVISKR